ncbi:MAG: hypothetical protein R3C05_13145 [Pirellulaceae bacterium]
MLLTLSILQLSVGDVRSEDQANAEAFFENKVRPLLIKRCYECHSREFDEQQGDLRVDTAPAIKRGGRVVRR